MNPLRKYYLEGYSFFHTGSPEKKVLTYWTNYQKRKPTDEEYRNWNKLKVQNWAIVCGKISNLIVFDVDTKNGADPTPFQNRGLYEVRTPSGGYHFYCKYDDSLSNTKHKRKDNEGILKAVDVQSNGAIVFASPTTFPNGTYTVVNDVPVTDIPEDLLIMVLEALEPQEEKIEKNYIQPEIPKDILRKLPGQIFEDLMTWDELLSTKGWTKYGRELSDGRQMWCRPGKHFGVSASTNYKGNDKLYVFTSSTALSPTMSYNKFAFITAMDYNGDYQAAAKDLKLRNYQLIHERHPHYAN